MAHQIALVDDDQNITTSVSMALDPISGINKMKFKNLSPDNPENLFVLSFKTNFMTIYA